MVAIVDAEDAQSTVDGLDCRGRDDAIDPRRGASADENAEPIAHTAHYAAAEDKSCGRPKSLKMPSPYEAVLFDLFGTLVDETGEALPGAAEALKNVPAARCAIVTSCPLRIAHKLLQLAQLPIAETIVAAEDVARGKPQPDGYLLAAERLGVEPARCLVIEDTSHGVAAAKAAGMDVIRVGERALNTLTFQKTEDGAIAVR